MTARCLDRLNVGNWTVLMSSKIVYVCMSMRPAATKFHHRQIIGPKSTKFWRGKFAYLFHPNRQLSRPSYSRSILLISPFLQLFHNATAQERQLLDATALHLRTTGFKTSDRSSISLTFIIKVKHLKFHSFCYCSKTENSKIVGVCLQVHSEH